jgi:hypothetical protein
MGTSPQNQSSSFLSQQQIDDKFNELDIMSLLENTCKGHPVKVTPVTSSLSGSKQWPRTAWRRVNYIRVSDGESQAILEWKEDPTQEEVKRVVQFTDQNGNFYQRA